MNLAATLYAAQDRPVKATLIKPTSPERATYIALAALDRDVPVQWKDGSSDEWNESNVVSKLYAAALAGTAYIWHAHSIKGQKEDTENKTDAVFGFSGQGDPVSVTEVYAFTLRDSAHEVAFYNRLRSQLSGQVHAFVFTQNAVIPILDEEITFHDVFPAGVDGNINSRITGTMNMSASQETIGDKGSHKLYFSRNFDQQLKNAPQLTITGGTYGGTPPLAVAACAGDVLRLTGLAAGTGRTIAFALAESGVACVSWSLFLQDGTEFVAPPAGWSINAATGVITVPNSVTAANLLKFAVVASLPNGVIGQKNFEVVTTA